MFITTSNNSDILTPEPAFTIWPGPCFLLLMPDHGLSDTELARAEARFVLFEFLKPPASPLSALRTALIAGRHCPGLFEAPLLFSDTACTVPDLEEQLKAVEEDPFLVRDTRDPEDALTHLLLGSGIVINPLFSVFIRNLAPEITGAFTDGALDAIREHLIWKEPAA